ncbi:metal ABC transporter permease [Synoicihabitans lomoniglobus]|uniref:Metal ABC transporter permease n=1 Tax=Synoicihabitans lomoniglobus TaxID=2909285 RepID=A0AAF0CS97_9BACT|nr:metal ABC transporter permease [Opitutaceae bacterium LMO-M01]WED67163.1 metal ABC transporter permease [Opitutaceae bacterium LMO-M01]
MNELIPAFDWHRVMVAPWTEDLALFGWIGLMGFLVTAACGLVGNYLILRRMALMGDAVSHSVLPGLVIAFLVSGSRGTWPMFLGALAAGVVTTLLIEAIHRRTRVKQDAAIGIAFSTLFAIGVLLTSIYSQQIDLDAECVLYGEIAFVPLEPFVEWGAAVLGPVSLVRMAGVLMFVVIIIVAFYKELLVASFDDGLSRAMGINPAWVHHGLMALLSIVVVSAFEAVGAILVIAMLILPGATASLLTQRLSRMHFIAVGHAALSAWWGVSLGVWLDCSIGAAMVVMGAVLFSLVWAFTSWSSRRSGRRTAINAGEMKHESA